MNINPKIKKGLKKSINFTLEKIIPQAIKFFEKNISETVKKYEKNDKITAEQLDELYNKCDKSLEALDKINYSTEALNEKVKNSKFFE